MAGYDSITVSCPVCSEDIEFKSTAGKCRYDTFSLMEVPAVIAKDLLGEYKTCKICGSVVQLLVMCQITPITLSIGD